MPESPKKDAAAPLPDRLVPDPKNPPDLTLLQGWLGASSEERCRRLYLDPELTNSLEIPEDAIVHVQEIPRDTNPLGGEWVWVKADAAIKQGPGIERMYARFLRGQIQQDYAAGAYGGGGMVGAPGPGAGTTGVIACQPIRTVFNCPTRTLWCRPSVLTICPSSPVICQVSAAYVCRTNICPSAVDACPSAPGGCDPWTIYQGGTIVQQPGFGGGAGGALGFDPGIAAGGVAGGMVGAGGPVTYGLICPPRTLTINCPTRQIWCRPSVLTICVSQMVVCHQTVLQTFYCPSVVDACPSAPGGCDPWTIYQQPGTIVQQPGFGGVAGGGLGFDPGIAAGGMVGAAGAAAFGAAAPLRPQTIFGPLCDPPWPTEVLSLCHPSRFPCHTVPFRLCFNVPSVPAGCQTYPGVCPSFVGCPSGPICGDPGGLATVVNPGVLAQGQAAGLGQMGFDPAGGMVGAPAQLTAQYASSPAVCQIATRLVICRPTLIYPCHTQTPICWFTRLPQCVTQFCTAYTCQTQPFCPTLAGCPSGPVCGGGGFPGGGGVQGGGF